MNTFTQPLRLRVLIDICNTFLNQRSSSGLKTAFVWGWAVYRRAVVVECHLVMFFPTTAWCERKPFNPSTLRLSFINSSYRYHPEPTRFILHFPEDMHCHGPCPKFLTFSWAMLWWDFLLFIYIPAV